MIILRPHVLLPQCWECFTKPNMSLINDSGISLNSWSVWLKAGSNSQLISRTYGVVKQSSYCLTWEQQHAVLVVQNADALSTWPGHNCLSSFAFQSWVMLTFLANHSMFSVAAVTNPYGQCGCVGGLVIKILQQMYLWTGLGMIQ